MRRVCFILGIGALSAGLYAADPGSAPSRVSVVHADARSGKLVRSVVIAPKPVVRKQVAETVIAPRVVEPTPVNPAAPPPASVPPKPAATDFNTLVASIAAEHRLPPGLIDSVIKVESNYNPNAISSKGALGLMQLIPATARRFGVSDVFDPVENIQGGARYLKYLLELFGGDYKLALAAYNAGEGAVAKYGDVPPYAETRNYLVQVKRRFEASQKAEQAARQNKENSEETKPQGPRQIQQVTDADGTVRYVVR